MPISLRGAGNTDPNHQVSVMMVSLCTHIAAPLERLQAIKGSAKAGKTLTGNFKAAIPTNFRRAGFYPVSIPAHGVALNMTVQRNNGALEVGSTACRCAQPDVTGLAGHAVHERELLRGLIDVLEATAPVIAAVVAPPAWKRSTVHASVVKAVEPLSRCQSNTVPKRSAPRVRARGVTS